MLECLITPDAREKCRIFLHSFLFVKWYSVDMTVFEMLAGAFKRNVWFPSLCTKAWKFPLTLFFSSFPAHCSSLPSLTSPPTAQTIERHFTDPHFAAWVSVWKLPQRRSIRWVLAPFRKVIFYNSGCDSVEIETEWKRRHTGESSSLLGSTTAHGEGTRNSCRSENCRRLTSTGWSQTYIGLRQIKNT